jgi:hypothetical protein
MAEILLQPDITNMDRQTSPIYRPELLEQSGQKIYLGLILAFTVLYD